MCVYMCPCPIQVVVSVGRSLSYTPGSITFVTSTVTQFPVTAVAWGVAGGGVSLILLLVMSMAIVLVACRRESVMRSQVDVLLMQVNTLAEEHYIGMCVLCMCVHMCVHFCVCLCVLCLCVCVHVHFFYVGCRL